MGRFFPLRQPFAVVNSRSAYHAGLEFSDRHFFAARSTIVAHLQKGAKTDVGMPY